MSSIKGFVEGLRDGVADNKEKYDRYIAIIANKTEKLDKLIDDRFLSIGNGTFGHTPK